VAILSTNRGLSEGLGGEHDLSAQADQPVLEYDPLDLGRRPFLERRQG